MGPRWALDPTSVAIRRRKGLGDGGGHCDDDGRDGRQHGPAGGHRGQRRHQQRGARPGWCPSEPRPTPPTPRARTSGLQNCDRYTSVFSHLGGGSLVTATGRRSPRVWVPWRTAAGSRGSETTGVPARAPGGRARASRLLCSRLRVPLALRPAPGAGLAPAAIICWALARACRLSCSVPSRPGPSEATFRLTCTLGSPSPRTWRCGQWARALGHAIHVVPVRFSL